MNPKVKSILLILLTLIIGYAAGFTTQSMLHQKRLAQIKNKMGRSAGHVELMKKTMEIRPEQEVNVNPILESFAPKMHQKSREFRMEMREMLDSLMVELSPHVEESQLEKLKTKFPRRRRPKKPH